MNWSRLVHFAPKSCVPCAQISSIFQINGRESLKLVYLRWLSRNGTRIFVWNMPSRKTETPFRIIRFCRKFSTGTIRKVAFLLHSNRIFWKRQFGRRDTGHQQYHTLKYGLKCLKQKDETISNFPQYRFMILFIRRLSSHRT